MNYSNRIYFNIAIIINLIYKPRRQTFSNFYQFIFLSPVIELNHEMAKTLIKSIITGIPPF